MTRYRICLGFKTKYENGLNRTPTTHTHIKLNVIKYQTKYPNHLTTI